MANRIYNDQVSTETEEAQTASKSPTPHQRGALIDLSPQDRQKIGRRIQKDIESWESSSSDRQANLRRWNDLFEGVKEETDYPWEGASQASVPLIPIHIITLHSVIARSLLTVDPLWYAKTLDENLRPIIPDVEEMLTYKAKSELNICDGVRDVVQTTSRDGLGWLMVPWVEEYEYTNDVEVIESIEEFINEFPDAESAGMTDEEYQTKLEEVRANASPDNPMEIEVSVDRLVYRGPKAELVDEADMMRVPMTAKEIRYCRTYGRRFYMGKNELRSRVREKAVWDDAVKSLLDDKKPNKTEQDSWRQGRNQIEGISQDNGRAADDYEIFEGVVKLDIERKGVEKKYFFTYCKSHQRLLGLSEYIYRKEIFIPWRMIKRPGRMIGKSVPEWLEELSHDIDSSIRQEDNNDSIRNVPIFKGKKGKQGTNGFDPQANENIVRPGVFWWLDDPEDVKVVNSQEGNNTDSVNRRQERMRYAEMLVGPTQLLSGKESPVDPNAPGNKTIALIQQSNMRIEDYINELRFGMDMLGEVILSHYYQFGGSEIDFESSKESNVIGTLRRTQLKGRFKLATHGVTANMNPEIEFGKALMWFQLLSKDPMVASDKMRYRELLNRLMLAGRLEGREELLPSQEEVQGIMAEEQAKAAEDAVLKKMLSQGWMPPPPQAPQPPPGSLTPTPATGSDLKPAVPMPGANPGSPGLPPPNNLPAGSL